MSEPPPRVGVAEVRSAGHQEAREASRALATFGARLGWGLVVLGILLGLGHGLASFVPEGMSPTGWITATLEAATWILAFGLAGRSTALACQLVAALIVARIERDELTADRLIAQAVRGVNLLEHFVEAGGPMTAPMPSSHHAEARRALSLAEIERSLGSERWAETESLLEAFRLAFPEDSSFSTLRDRLDAARRQAVQDQLAQLDAARQVNDPARVIELYQAIVPMLDSDRRAELASQLAKWFLELIHRRLRTGKIQADVVLLATQVAETFGATVEGASMRAALPTLRRSVGLCPRCAQPYKGTADACPQCLAAGPGLITRPSTELAHGTLISSLISQTSARHSPRMVRLDLLERSCARQPQAPSLTRRRTSARDE